MVGGRRRRRDEAERGEDVARHHAYAASLNLAERDWRDANVAEVLRHLEETRPPQGKSDLRGFEWYYLDRLCRVAGPALRGTGGPSRAWPTAATAAASPRRATTRRSSSGTRAPASSSARMTADDGVFAVAFHPDGTRLASAGYDASVTLWDVATGQVIRTLDGAHPGGSFELEFSPDGKTLASSSDDGTVRLWDGGDGSLLRTLADHSERRIGGLAFSPDSKVLASAGGGEPTIRTWDVATGRLIRTFEDDVLHPAEGLAGRRRSYTGLSQAGGVLARRQDPGLRRRRTGRSGSATPRPAGCS